MPDIAPDQESGDVSAVGLAGLFVANVGSEEFDEAPGGALAGGGDQGRQRGADQRKDDDEFGVVLGHPVRSPYSRD